VNVYLFTSPRFRPLDNAGAIMVGSYLQFFDSETDAPTPVYADATLNTELGTEVESNGNGEFEPMYMDPEVTYKVRFFNALDVLQWEVDPYTPPRDWPAGSIVMFYGDATARDAAYPPALWQVCDGSSGSPDMRDRFPIGVSGDKDVGETGGAVSSATEPAGGHDHGGATASEVLTEANLPQHHHRLYVRTSDTQRGNTRGFGYSGTAGVEGQIIDDAPYDYQDTAPQSGSNTLIENAGEADPDGHAHDISAELDHTHDITASLPPWLALWFLMRKAS
jgi:hypothetical protein